MAWSPLWPAAQSEILSVRYSPELRSAYVERFEDAPRVLTVYGKATYMDTSILDSARQEYLQHDLGSFVVSLLVRPPANLEVPEPLWTRKALQTFAMVAAARLGGLLHRRRVVISTYCIENEHAERIARLPEWVPLRTRVHALVPLLIPFVFWIDRWCFGTPAARHTYESVLGRRLSARLRRRATTILPLPERCRACAPRSDSADVLFVGELSYRKGAETVLDAWAVLDARAAGRLFIVGDGPLRDVVDARRRADDRITWISDASRAEIHFRLNRASVLILPSRPERYWREQIGLPIIEGLAHGCRIVTSNDTGIAEWLVQNDHIVVDSGASADEYASALTEALRFGPVSNDLPPINGRAQAAEWMFANHNGPRG